MKIETKDLKIQRVKTDVVNIEGQTYYLGTNPAKKVIYAIDQAMAKLMALGLPKPAITGAVGYGITGVTGVIAGAFMLPGFNAAAIPLLFVMAGIFGAVAGAVAGAD